MRVGISALISLLLGSVPVGCSTAHKPQTPNERGPTAARTNTVAAEPATGQPVAPSSSPEDDGTRRLTDPFRGKVKETMDAGGYTYVLLAAPDRDVWAAAKRVLAKL